MKGHTNFPSRHQRGDMLTRGRFHPQGCHPYHQCFGGGAQIPLSCPVQEPTKSWCCHQPQEVRAQSHISLLSRTYHHYQKACPSYEGPFPATRRGESQSAKIVKPADLQEASSTHFSTVELDSCEFQEMMTSLCCDPYRKKANIHSGLKLTTSAPATMLLHCCFCSPIEKINTMLAVQQLVLNGSIRHATMVTVAVIITSGGYDLLSL